MATRKLYIHPNDIETFRTHCPFSFTKQARSNTPSQSQIVCGGVYPRSEDTFYPLYWTFGYGEGTLDFLEKVDEENTRICCYLANVDTEEIDGVIKPYIYYDDETMLASGRFGITIYNGENDNTNLQQIAIEGSYKQFAFSETQDNLATSIWDSPKPVHPASGGVTPSPTINYDANGNALSSLVIDASIPIFVDEESAREYIDTGNVLAGKCFNLDEMMLADASQVMISSRTYEYDQDKNKIGEDSATHTLYIRTFDRQNISAYVEEGDYYNIHIQVKQNGSAVDTIQVREGSGTFQTMTIDEFNSSQYAKYNTWREFKKYGINEFVKGNLFRSTIPICKNKADSDLWNNNQQDKVIPLNFDSDGNPVNMSDSGTPCDSEADLDDSYKSGASGLITLYQLSSANMVTLGNAIFDTSSSIGDMIKDALSIYGDSPINAIISVYHCPIDISSMTQLSNDSLVRLGLYNLTCEGAQTVIRYGKLMTLGSTVINPFYNDFRDFTNFEFELHLPFSSPIPLEAREIMNKTLTIKATCDAYAMQLRYYICIDGIVQKTVDCSFGHQVAIMGNDFAGKAKEVRQELVNLASSGISFATCGLADTSETSSKVGGSLETEVQTTSNIGGAVSIASGIQASVNALTKEPRKTTVGSFASGCAESDVLYPYLSITETVSIKPDALESTYGLPSNYIGRLGNVSGFTCAELTRLEVPCTSAEREEISAILKGGIII